VNVALLEQLASHRLPGAAFEDDVVRDHDGCTAVDREQRLDVLHEVELLVRRRRPEVVSDDHELLALALALGVHDRHRRLLAERRVRQHELEAVARVGLERVVDADRAVGLLGADAVQEQIHHAEAGCVVDDLPAVQRVEAEGALLVGIEVGVVLRDPLVRGEQEAARAARGIADRHPRLGTHHLDERADQRPRREVLTGARLDVLGVLLEQSFVRVALDVGVERKPGLAVDQVDDQPPQLRGVLDPVLRLAEDDAEHPRPPAELGQHVPVVHLQLVAVPREQARPVEPLRDERLGIERRLRLLVGHLGGRAGR